MSLALLTAYLHGCVRNTLLRAESWGPKRGMGHRKGAECLQVSFAALRR